MFVRGGRGDGSARLPVEVDVGPIAHRAGKDKPRGRFLPSLFVDEALHLL